MRNCQAWSGLALRLATSGDLHHPAAGATGKSSQTTIRCGKFRSHVLSLPLEGLDSVTSARRRVDCTVSAQDNPHNRARHMMPPYPAYKCWVGLAEAAAQQMMSRHCDGGVFRCVRVVRTQFKCEIPHHDKPFAPPPPPPSLVCPQRAVICGRSSPVSITTRPCAVRHDPLPCDRRLRRGGGWVGVGGCDPCSGRLFAKGLALLMTLSRRGTGAFGAPRPQHFWRG